MSVLDRIFGGLKAVMLMDERFDRINDDLRGLGGDFAELARSHAELAQRVARIEGVMDGYARASSSSRRPRLPKQ